MPDTRFEVGRYLSIDPSLIEVNPPAWDGSKHHIIAFWGEGGRTKAIEQCDKYIADPSLDKTWTTAQWQKHKGKMEKRESRYQKTKADIDKALKKQDVEPDLPPDVVPAGA